jgi:hypothetical protein
VRRLHREYLDAIKRVNRYLAQCQEERSARRQTESHFLALQQYGKVMMSQGTAEENPPGRSAEEGVRGARDRL